jgi:hypothetical protein
MRVIAGVAGGIQLDVPKTNVRPTMDRVKAAIFSSLGERIIGARVLDLFAGTGGLGIEALSRGAASALFVEDNAAAIGAIERNLTRTKLQGQIRRQDVFCFSGFIKEPRAVSDHFCRSPIRENEVRWDRLPTCCCSISDWRKCWNRPACLSWKSVPRKKGRRCRYGTLFGRGRMARPKYCSCNMRAVPQKCVCAPE